MAELGFSGVQPGRIRGGRDYFRAKVRLELGRRASRDGERGRQGCAGRDCGRRQGGESEQSVLGVCDVEAGARGGAEGGKVYAESETAGDCGGQEIRADAGFGAVGARSLKEIRRYGASTAR